MGRIRTIKPSFFRSRSLAKCSLRARIFYAGIWTEADDLGRGVADPRILKGSLWPLDDDVTAADVEDDLYELATTGHIVLYEVGGERYFEVVKFGDHQSSAYRRGVSHLPPPPPDNPPPKPRTILHDETCKEMHQECKEVLEGKGRDNGKGDDDSLVSETEHTETEQSSSSRFARRVAEKYANLVMARPEHFGKSRAYRAGIVRECIAEHETVIYHAFGEGGAAEVVAARLAELDDDREGSTVVPLEPAPAHPVSCHCEGEGNGTSQAEVHWEQNGKWFAAVCPGPEAPHPRDRGLRVVSGGAA